MADDEPPKITSLMTPRTPLQEFVYYMTRLVLICQQREALKEAKKTSLVNPSEEIAEMDKTADVEGEGRKYE